MRRIRPFLSVLALAFAGPALAVAGPVDSPLERIPTDAELFVHIRVAAIWDLPVMQEIRKHYPGAADAIFGPAERFLGQKAEQQIDTVTVYVNRFPRPDDDDEVFPGVLQVTTREPYDKKKLIPGHRKAQAEDKDGVVKFDDGMELHFLSPKHYAVLDMGQAEAFRKPLAVKPGPLAAALKTARDPAAMMTIGGRPERLPKSVTERLPQSFKPYLSLLTAKTFTVTVSTEKSLAIHATFTTADDDAAKRLEDVLTGVKKDAEAGVTAFGERDDLPVNVKEMTGLLRDVAASVHAATVTRDGSTVSAKVSVTVKGDLAKMVAGGVSGVRKAANRLKSSNNLKQLSLAILNYSDVVDGVPPAAIVDPATGKPLLSWRVAMLPYLGHDALYKQFKLTEAWDSPHNKKLLAEMPAVFALPGDADAKAGETRYLAFVGKGTVFNATAQTRLSAVKDGDASTVMLCESAKHVPWTKPEDVDYDPAKPVAGALHFIDDTCQVAFVNGSVKALAKTLEDKLWHQFIQMADGNPPPAVKK